MFYRSPFEAIRRSASQPTKQRSNKSFLEVQQWTIRTKTTEIIYIQIRLSDVSATTVAFFELKTLR